MIVVGVDYSEDSRAPLRRGTDNAAAALRWAAAEAVRQDTGRAVDVATSVSWTPPAIASVIEQSAGLAVVVPLTR